MNKINIPVLIALTALITFSSCKKKETDITSLKKSVVENYAAIVYASYDDAVKKAQDLKAALVTFTTTPNQTNFDAAKAAYIASREPYGQTDGYRFYGGPIDDNDGKEGEINAWPLDEVYIDYVQGNASAGLINDAVGFPTINTTTIAAVNGAGGETNVSTGFHAIEFLLWGQDLYSASAGLRPYTDYLTTGGTASNQARRAQYILALTDLLIEDLTYTRDAWAAGASYRKAFTEQDATKSLELILTGMGKFCDGELYGERMLTAYDTQSQEDEHSCFSDQTQRDFVLGQKSLDNIYFGTYTRVDGTKIDGAGFDDLLNEKDYALKMSFENQLKACYTTVDGIKSPFDQEIVDVAGRTRVKNAIDNGKVLSVQIVSLAKALGITITL